MAYEVEIFVKTDNPLNKFISDLEAITNISAVEGDHDILFVLHKDNELIEIEENVYFSLPDLDLEHFDYVVHIAVHGGRDYIENFNLRISLAKGICEKLIDLNYEELLITRSMDIAIAEFRK